QRDGGAVAAAAAEDDVGLAAVAPARVGVIRPDDQVGEAVAVHVPCTGHADARIRVILEAAEGDAASSQRVQRDGGAGAAAAAEDDVRLPAVGPARVRVSCPDDQVGEAVAVHVPRPGHAAAGVGGILEAAEGDAASPQRVQRDGGAGAAAAAEDDVRLP